MSSRADITIVDVTDASAFARLPGCANPRFDHRSCDYWEDDVRGSKAARASWWQGSKPAPRPKPKPSPASDNPFAPPPRDDVSINPFAREQADDAVAYNPFAPEPAFETSETGRDGPRKLHLLDRGHAVFGPYAKVVLLGAEPAAYAQFGPLSAYPRAQRIRDLYPSLPQSPLPAVITCVATTAEARGQGLARRLVEAVADDLAQRGFAAIEAYPDLDLGVDEASAATPRFWERCGFEMAVSDDRYPVMRRELE